MNSDRLLGLYHFCNLYHSGQWSRLYKLSCKIAKVYKPSFSEEYSTVLSRPGYEEAKDVFRRLVQGETKDYGTGYHECNGCAREVMCENAISAIVLCDSCVGEGYEEDYASSSVE